MRGQNGGLAVGQRVYVRRFIGYGRITALGPGQQVTVMLDSVGYQVPCTPGDLGEPRRILKQRKGGRS